MLTLCLYTPGFLLEPRQPKAKKLKSNMESTEAERTEQKDQEMQSSTPPQKANEPPLSSFEKMPDLPNELVLEVCTFLSISDLLSFSLVSTRYNAIANSNRLWYRFATARWPARNLKNDVTKYEGKFKNLLRDGNGHNVFYFNSRLCDVVKMAERNTVAHIEQYNDNCILLAHRGMTRGCYTFRVLLTGTEGVRYALFGFKVCLPYSRSISLRVFLILP